MTLKTDVAMTAAKALCMNQNVGCVCTGPNHHGQKCIAQRVFGDQAAAVATRLDTAGFLREPVRGWRKALARWWNATPPFSVVVGAALDSDGK